jgi:hypothetical protein
VHARTTDTITMTLPTTQHEDNHQRPQQRKDDNEWPSFKKQSLPSVHARTTYVLHNDDPSSRTLSSFFQTTKTTTTITNTTTPTPFITIVNTSRCRTSGHWDKHTSADSLSLCDYDIFGAHLGFISVRYAIFNVIINSIVLLQQFAILGALTYN